MREDVLGDYTNVKSESDTAPDSTKTPSRGNEVAEIFKITEIRLQSWTHEVSVRMET